MKKIIQAMKGGRPRKYYLQSVGIFQKLDIEGTSQALSLEEKGRVAGQVEKPSTDSDSNDAVENKIISIIEDEKDYNYDEAVKGFTAYRERLKCLGIETLIQRLEEGGKKIITDIRAILYTLTNSSIYQLSRDIVKKKSDLEYFRKVNRLHREPIYNDSKVLGVALLLLIFLLESGLNGYFFAKGHEQGYLGGVSVAIIISIVNVVFNSFLLGWFFLRQITHINWGRKIIGFLSLFLFVIAALGFNIAVAHYRQAFVMQAEDPGQMVVKTLLSDPLQLHDFNSYMLIIMGLSVCLVTCIDFWTMYDPYPGYEKHHRKLNELEDDYAQSSANIVDSLQHIRDDGFNEIKDTLHELEARQEEYRTLIARMDNLKSQIKPYFSRLEQNGRELLTIYRDASASTRLTASPNRWQREFVLPMPDLNSFQIPSIINVSSVLNKARNELPEMTKNINKECSDAINSLVPLSSL